MDILILKCGHRRWDTCDSTASSNFRATPTRALLTLNGINVHQIHKKGVSSVNSSRDGLVVRSRLRSRRVSGPKPDSIEEPPPCKRF
ncbi:hypothetical protein AVEN_258188-1 [Araneus ventricosus]|uniref:Uncharacterized protein n=1 Tax=Araneus ventricosus TaxID=182803 RepID=A0A4Y2JZP8_ARAVE|nr:hypothetical protein AVEN_258188-1 [Araneus ventricosus]